MDLIEVDICGMTCPMYLDKYFGSYRMKQLYSSSTATVGRYILVGNKNECRHAWESSSI
jgi:hypothetical protein